MSLPYVSRRKAGERKLKDGRKQTALMLDNIFPSVFENSRRNKPRKIGITAIEALGDDFEDVFEGLSPWVDIVRVPSSFFPYTQDDVIRSHVSKAHSYGLHVSTGDWAEQVLACSGTSAIDKFVKNCKFLGFDIVEVKTNVPGVSEQAVVRLIRALKNVGLTVEPQIGINDVGNSLGFHLSSSDFGDSIRLVQQAERFLKAGADVILVDSEGLTDGVDIWRTDIIASIVGHIGLERIMFTAGDTKAVEWFVRSYGPEVNFIVNHNHVVPLEGWRTKNGVFSCSSRMVYFNRPTFGC